MRRPKRLIGIMVPVLAAALIYGAGCAPAPASQPAAAGKTTGSDNPIVIGLVTEVTGAQASTGDNQTNGIKHGRRRDGTRRAAIKGRQIKLRDRGRHLDSPGHRQRLQQADRPSRSRSRSSSPTSPTSIWRSSRPSSRSAIPAITGASGPGVTAAGNPWIFRVRTNDNIMGRLAAEYAVKEMGAKKIGILYVTGEMGAGASKVVKENLASPSAPPLSPSSPTTPTTRTSPLSC